MEDLILDMEAQLTAARQVLASRSWTAEQEVELQQARRQLESLERQVHWQRPGEAYGPAQRRFPAVSEDEQALAARKALLQQQVQLLVEAQGAWQYANRVVGDITLRLAESRAQLAQHRIRSASTGASVESSAGVLPRAAHTEPRGPRTAPAAADITSAARPLTAGTDAIGAVKPESTQTGALGPSVAAEDGARRESAGRAGTLKLEATGLGSTGHGAGHEHGQHRIGGQQPEAPLSAARVKKEPSPCPAPGVVDGPGNAPLAPPAAAAGAATLPDPTCPVLAGASGDGPAAKRRCRWGPAPHLGAPAPPALPPHPFPQPACNHTAQAAAQPPSRSDQQQDLLPALDGLGQQQLQQQQQQQQGPDPGPLLHAAGNHTAGQGPRRRSRRARQRARAQARANREFAYYDDGLQQQQQQPAHNPVAAMEVAVLPPPLLQPPQPPPPLQQPMYSALVAEIGELVDAIRVSMHALRDRAWVTDDQTALMAQQAVQHLQRYQELQELRSTAEKLSRRGSSLDGALRMLLNPAERATAEGLAYMSPGMFAALFGIEPQPEPEAPDPIRAMAEITAPVLHNLIS